MFWIYFEFKVDRFVDGLDRGRREREEVKIVLGFWFEGVKERSCYLGRWGRLKESNLGRKLGVGYWCIKVDVFVRNLNGDRVEV